MQPKPAALAPRVARDLTDLFVGDDVHKAQKNVPRQLFLAEPARKINLRGAQMHAQSVFTAENLRGAAQRASVNVVKHSPPQGCYFENKLQSGI